MRITGMVVFWIVWVTAGVSAELFALFTHRVPLTGVALYSMERWPIVRGLVFALLGWLFLWHWTFEPPRFRGGKADDGIIATVLIAIGMKLERRK